MSKQQIIDAIREHNHSAEMSFLVNFEEKVLESYLKRLTTIKDHRGRGSQWVREGDTHAVVTKAA